MARDGDLFRCTEISNEEMEGTLTEPYEKVLTSPVGNIEHIDLRLQYEVGSHYSVADDSADSSAATGTFTSRLGVGRTMPSFFIL